MAHWDRRTLLELSRGFMEPRVLLTGAELGVFSLLGKDPLRAQELAGRLGADLRALTIVLDALCAMGLLRKHAERYCCEPPVRDLLGEDTPGSVLPMVLHAARLWRTWSELSATVAGPRTPDLSPEARLRAFIGAMHVIGEPHSARIVSLVNPGEARQLLDVGGASGTYTLAFLEAVPGMTATLFDRPDVIELARERLGRAGVLGRVRLVAGDFLQDALPGGHTLAFLSAVIHQNSPAENETLYRSVHDALVPGGRIVIRDHVMNPDRIRPRTGALFAVNMLAGNTGGNSYTYREIRDGLTAAGLVRVRLVHRDANMDGLVEAFRPGPTAAGCAG